MMHFFKKLRLKADNFKPSSKGEDKAVQSDSNPSIVATSHGSSTSRTNWIVARSTNAAFQEAWETHWQELTEEEKTAWSFERAEDISALKIEKAIEDLDKSHKERSITRKCADQTLRFLSAVDTLMAGVLIGIQQYPEVSSIVSGVVRIIIKVAVKYFEYYVKLTAMLERLSDEIEVFDLYSKTSGCEPLLHKTLVAIYGDILTFCRQARRVFVNAEGQEKKQASLSVFLKVQWAPFEEQFGAIQSDLKFHTSTLKKVTSAVILASTVDIQEDLNRKRLSERKNEREDFLRWISEEDSEEIHNLLRSQRHADTGSWLLSTKEFERWLSEDCSNPLWCFGQAGVGKSVLASMVVDDLVGRSTQKDVAVAYVYLKGEDTDMQHLPARVVSMLIKQLCWKMPTLPEDVLDFYHRFTGDARKPLFEDLQGLFVKCTHHLKHVFIVLDGLDECAELYRRPILQFICTVGISGMNVKAFVTSRWEHDIYQTFSHHRVSRLAIEPMDVKNDISEVVMHRVATELGRITPGLQKEVIQILTEKSGGMFLWVDLQLRDLVQVPEPDIKRQLAMLPTGLEATYIRVFRKMSKLPKTSRSLARKSFLWAFHAKRLLYSDELIDAISLENKMQYHDGSQLAEYSSRDISEITSNLLQISVLGFNRVRPIHFSLRELFFMDFASADIPPECRDFFPTPEEAQAQLAVLCLQHLLVKAPPAEALNTILLYCATFFDSHIKSLSTISQTLMDLLDQLFWKEPHQLVRILALRWPVSHDKYPDVDCPGTPKSVDPTFFLRCTKLDSVPQIWSRYADAAESSCHYPEHYLHLAALAGLTDIVKAIISSDDDIDINRIDAPGFTALHYACTTGESDMIEFLLDRGAAWSSDGYSGVEESPVVDAVKRRDWKVVDLFIRRKDVFNLAALIRSMGKDDDNVIKTLLDRGADVNQRDDDDGNSALEVALSAGLAKIAKLLVAHGAKDGAGIINSQTPEGSSAAAVA